MTIASLIEKAQINGVNPRASLAGVPGELDKRCPNSSFDDLISGVYAKRDAT